MSNYYLPFTLLQKEMSLDLVWFRKNHLLQILWMESWFKGLTCQASHVQCCRLSFTEWNPTAIIGGMCVHPSVCMSVRTSNAHYSFDCLQTLLKHCSGVWPISGHTKNKHDTFNILKFWLDYSGSTSQQWGLGFKGSNWIELQHGVSHASCRLHCRSHGMVVMENLMLEHVASHA